MFPPITFCFYSQWFVTAASKLGVGCNQIFYLKQVVALWAATRLLRAKSVSLVSTAVCTLSPPREFTAYHKMPDNMLRRGGPRIYVLVRTLFIFEIFISIRTLQKSMTYSERPLVISQKSSAKYHK